MLITWSNGVQQTLSSEVLRLHCPCATCRESRGDESHQKPITGKPAKKSLLQIVDHAKEEELKLTEIWSVGNYAIGMQWADGHNTGIYPFQLLREL